MVPPNPAFRRVRVRRSLLLSLGLLTLLPWSSARDPQGLSPAKTLVGAAAGREGTRNRAAEHPVPALPPSPFTYLHGARPRPAARPDERVLFRLDGTAGPQTFTLRQLQALPAVRYATYQPQLKHEGVYEGVPLRDLAALGGFAGRDVRVYASNGFVATIRAHDYLHEPIMLAYRMDGQAIPVLQKGPLTVVLPRRPARFHTPAYSAAWVWFAVRLGPVP